MALYMDQFNQLTLSGNNVAYYNWTWPGDLDYGPNYVSAYFVGAAENWGTVTTKQTSTTAFETTQFGYYWPTGISYQAQLLNESSWSVLITLNIGDFK